MKIKYLNFEDGYQEIILTNGDKFTTQFPQSPDSITYKNDVEIEDNYNIEVKELNKLCHKNYKNFALSCACAYPVEKYKIVFIDNREVYLCDGETKIVKSSFSDYYNLELYEKHKEL